MSAASIAPLLGVLACHQAGAQGTLSGTGGYLPSSLESESSGKHAALIDTIRAHDPSGAIRYQVVPIMRRHVEVGADQADFGFPVMRAHQQRVIPKRLTPHLANRDFPPNPGKG